MRIKNISGKIVSIGDTVLLPNETKEVKGYDNSDALAFLIERKKLRVVQTAAQPATAKKTAAKGK